MVTQYIDQVIAAIFCPYYFVYIGARTAPRARISTAAVLASAIALTYLALIYYEFVHPKIDTDPAWYIILTAVLGIAAAVIAVDRIQRDSTRPTRGDSLDWIGSAFEVLSNLFGIMYAYAYFGQVVLFFRIVLAEVSVGWLMVFNPIVDLTIAIALVTSWYFWSLLAVGFVGYHAMTGLSKLAEGHRRSESAGLAME